MKKLDFPDGGFVIHKITGGFEGKISTWFDKNGKLLDVEQLIGDRSRPVKVGGPIWRDLELMGKRHTSK